MESSIDSPFSMEILHCYPEVLEFYYPDTVTCRVI